MSTQSAEDKETFEVAAVLENGIQHSELAGYALPSLLLGSIVNVTRVAIRYGISMKMTRAEVKGYFMDAMDSFFDSMADAWELT